MTPDLDKLLAAVGETAPGTAIRDGRIDYESMIRSYRSLCASLALRLAEARDLVRKWPSLECPCCGEEGAFATYFEDGQPTTCGCSGQVMADGEDAHITIDDSDEECPKCGTGTRQGGSR